LVSSYVCWKVLERFGCRDFKKLGRNFMWVSFGLSLFIALYYAWWWRSVEMDDMSSSWSQCFTPEDAKNRVQLHERRMCPAGMSFPQYLEALQSSGQAQCTTVWTKGTVAYRCRKCQVNDSRFANENNFSRFSALMFVLLWYYLR